jgi:hypothetical protein
MSVRVTGILAVLALLAVNAGAADIILNEYNAVDPNAFLGGGDSSADDNGGRASDSYFGRVPGNGGDWFEMVVITDHLDIRGWSLDIYESGLLDETLTLTVNPIWQDLRAGTIITVSEDLASDVSYDPNAGDWWINVQANNNGDGLYIEKSNFPVTASNWQLRIRNLAGQVVFGPAGEGISPASGISGTEIFRLEDNPSATVTAGSTDYDDADDFSTFGSPNRWGSQSFNKLRPTVTADVATVTILTPNGDEALTAGDILDITWDSENVSETVLVEFSLDNGYSWNAVYPANVGNTGTYTWLAPLVAADQALVRVSSTTRPAVYDVSDKSFTVVGGLFSSAVKSSFDISRLAWAWMN